MSKSPHYKGQDKLKQQERELITFDSGNNKVEVKSLALDVTWGGDERYWKIESESITLLQVSWLEVTGAIDMKKYLKENQSYKLSFEIKMKPDAFGWNGCPVYLMAKPGDKGKYIWKSADLTQLPSGVLQQIPRPSAQLTFTAPPSFNSTDKLYFGLFEIWRGRWKGGLEIVKVIIEKI